MSEHNGEGEVSALPVMQPWKPSLQPYNLQTEFHSQVNGLILITFILPRGCVIMDGFWIDDQIYWTL
jgi:hypothetical protein